MNSILRGREKRVIKRKQFIEKNLEANSFICLTINMPGLDKRNEFSKKLFYDAKKTIQQLLEQKDIAVIDDLKFTNEAGDVFLLAAAVNPEKLKKIVLKIEEEHISGRLFDIDIYNKNDISVSRSDINYPPRKCFICNQNAKVCIRTAKHCSQEIKKHLEKEKNKFDNYLEKKINKAALVIEEIAYKSVLKELFTTPKPGLVDLDDQGSHDDMNIDTFLKSSKAIKPFFSKFFKIGANYFLQADKFDRLRKIGKKAEIEMFKATAGINTQKGIIFSFALITAAVGEIFSRGIDFKRENIAIEISKVVKNWTTGLVEAELAAKVEQRINGENHFVSKSKLTHGQLIYLKYGISGARGEAETGFENIIKYALPELKKYIEAGYYQNLCSIQALISLISEVDDSNILFRSDIQTLRYIQNKFKQLKDNGGILKQSGKKEYKKLCNFIKEKSVSPGGSADLLAATHLFFNIEKNLDRIII